MYRANIDTRRWWGAGCHYEPAFTHCETADLSVTNHLAEHSIGLPFFPDISQSEIDRTVAAVVKHIQNLPCDKCAVYPIGKKIRSAQS
jgi:dTDP-4-amino-4,6-dideoxygalactose transaminase